MPCKKIFFSSLFFISNLLLLNSLDGISQTLSNAKINSQSANETFENIYLHWSIAVDKARISARVSRADFDLFTRFSQKKMDSLRADFMNRIGNKTVTANNVGKFESTMVNSILSLYKNYEEIKKEYPSSIEEYRNSKPLPPSPCSSACTNIDFETGNLSGWNAYYGYNSSSFSFNVTNITGGPVGAVTHAADDVLTSTPGYYNNSVGPSPSPDYQINITSGSRGDAIVPSVPVVSPFGGSYSVMLGDSSLVNYGVAILSQTFLITPSNENFIYQYAVFLANPLHTYYDQPFFSIVLLDQAGDTIPDCGEYSVVAGNGTQSFDSITYNDSLLSETYTVYYKNWTMVNVPLKKYLGQCVTIIFESADCSLGGHFGYAYIDASCSPNGIISSSPNFCGQDSISLIAPPGGDHYIWTGPPHGILGNANGQTVWVDSAGVYRVIIVPVTGFACADTLYDTVGKVPGPPPKPSFYTNMACAGEITHFINTSTDTATATFYWDFYNIGVYNDSNVVDPTWTYVTPGTYTVKLDEVYNGCGADTLIHVTIDNPAVGIFSVSNGCVGSVINMPNSSTGATKYSWNYGDPRSGPRDTSSIIVNGSHIYATPGTYTITLIANNSGSCPDTVKQTVTIYPIPKPVITGLDSVCPNYNDTLKVTGGTSYLWSTGATTSSVIVATATTETLTVTASSGPCTHDTSFIVYIVSPSPVIAASKNSICGGDSVVLTASGSGSYRWSNNSTLSHIVVYPLATTTYTLYSTIGECTDSATTTVTLLQGVSLKLSVSSDTVCQRSPATITVRASGGSHFFYTWSTGQTTSSISPSPNSTTVYTVQVSNGSCTKDTSITIFVKISPTLSITSLRDTICLGQSVALNISGATGYSWLPPTGLSCSNCPNPIAAPTESTSYKVIGTDTDGCKDSGHVFILVDTHPILGAIPNISTCQGTFVTLSANEISGFDGHFTWDPGGSSNQSITVFPSTTTTYTVQYRNVCGDTSTTVTVSVKPQPDPHFSADITSGCAPLCIQFRDLSTLSAGKITIWTWAFGDGDTLIEQNPIYCYPDTGTFSPKITVVADNGCSATLKIVDMITVFSKPIANFTYSPQPVNILEPTVQFIDQSTDAYGVVYRLWSFGDAEPSYPENTATNPIHIYQDTGIFCPQLIVENRKGCVDTVTNCLFVEPLFTLYIPSAFSPNGDGTNDVFEAKGTYIKSFEMYVFDRWGMELFHSTSINHGWNGTVAGGNVISQEDVYVYKITATDWSNTQHSYVGNITLIK